MFIDFLKFNELRKIEYKKIEKIHLFSQFNIYYYYLYLFL